METQWNEFQENHSKFVEKGNRAAATRARKARVAAHLAHLGQWRCGCRCQSPSRRILRRTTKPRRLWHQQRLILRLRCRKRFSSPRSSPATGPVTEFSCASASLCTSAACTSTVHGITRAPGASRRFRALRTLDRYFDPMRSALSKSASSTTSCGCV